MMMERTGHYEQRGDVEEWVWDDLPVSTPAVEEEAQEETAEYSEWTVEELRDALRGRDLMVSGTKDELIARLEEDDEG
ncbi:MAG: SAP domain-containing protein [Nitrospiraceae bacterium]